MIECKVPEVIVKAVMSIFEVTTKVRVGLVVFNKYSVKVGVHLDSIITAFVCNSDGCDDGGCKKWRIS